MNAAALRTKTQEAILQDGAPEDQEWEAICSVHRAQESYARERAKRLLYELDLKVEKHGLMPVLKLIADGKWLLTLFEIEQVAQDHLDFAVLLVQRCFARKYELAVRR